MKTTTAKPTQAGRRMRAVSPMLQQALDAGRRVCDDMQDGPEARQAMKREILEIADTDERLLVGLVAGLTHPRLKRADFSTTTTQQPKE
ncbi:hypothetical protein [Comamonas koreensis]|uniref:Uncharacterized protein n=1 Tax=Comamonas koreensis TaxID=160825 RepID=A0AAW4XZP5_9BURK|nr:hypothetical protein [Comamonas koreensis]MCD2166847.1 hypothetical protein [Comamonas koreensis]